MVVMALRICVAGVLLLCAWPWPAWAERFSGAPQGYTLVAEDDCGNLDDMPHVIRGKVYVFPASMVSATIDYRDIIFDNDFCVLRYKKLDPSASYKVDVVYVSQAGGGRVQTLEANGRLVHDKLPLPVREPGRFIFAIPPAAYADGGLLELKFIRSAGGNAVVSHVRIWSTDPRPLPGRRQVWTPSGPVEKDWSRQDRVRGKPNFVEWEDPAKEVRDHVVPCIGETLARGRQILDDLRSLRGEGLDESAAELAAAAKARDRLLAHRSLDPEAWLKVYLQARWAVRRLAFKNPLLDGDGLLFVRRHHPAVMHQCARRLGSFTLAGGGICILKDIRADGQGEVECITDGRFPVGTFGRPDLSFDAKRIVFGYARERGPKDRRHSGGISQRTAALYATHQIGPCREFQVWEMGLDGASPRPRQLTTGPSENSDPLYLPSGRIAFMSHRPGSLVQCGDWALAYCVFTMEPDGTGVRQITVSKDGEWDPFLLADGTIGFTRWEYVMKFWSPIQMLWSVRPDGTNPRMVYGSDLSRQYAYPLNYAAARQIPGTSKVVCIGSAHHNTGAGPLCIVDLATGSNFAEGMTRITPVRFVETPDMLPHSGWYDCPFPLSEKYFLVSYTFSQHEADTRGYAIYLFDVYGGKELVYRDAELSALFPTPVRPRMRPGAVGDVAQDALGAYGEFVIQDAHEGLADSARGMARYVRIVEVHERHIHTSPYNIQVGSDSGFATKTVLGTVPVESDGSAYFRVPAGKGIFFSVLDERRQALHTMRSVTSIQPGERTACVGCHEPQRQTPANRTLRATQRAASRIQPPAWGVRTMDYAALIQPLLDKHCVRCHDGTKAKGKAYDLTDRRKRPFMGVGVPQSYFNLRKYVRHAPIYRYHMAPGTFGSRVSPLMTVLAKGHNNVKLSSEDWRLLCAWIDCNAPYLGRYDTTELAAAQPQKLDPAPYGEEHINARRKELQQGAPAGCRLAAYVDCGAQVADAPKAGPTLRQARGWPYVWGGSDKAAGAHFGSITFDDIEVIFDAAGLDPNKRYRLGFTWWDYDAGGREQSVHVEAGEPSKSTLLVPRTRLPGYHKLKQPPEQRCLPVAPELYATGKLRISFRKDGGPNAVVSEVWLWEGERD